MKTKVTEAELDLILKSVDEAFNSLAKADPSQEDDAPIPAAPMNQAPAAPAAEAPMAELAPSEAPAPEANPARAPAEQSPEANPDQALEGEVSDEELGEIYGSMPMEELERHYMIIRSLLQGQYEQEAPAQEPQAEAPAAPQAPAPEMGKSEANSAEELKKAEDRFRVEMDQMKKENEDMKKSLEIATKAITIALQPKRKSIAGMSELSIIEKGEKEVKEHTKEEIIKGINEKVSDPALSKNERDLINQYMFTGAGKDKIVEIIFGGKK